MNKVCPVVIRTIKNGYEVLAFTHPLAGKQIVKGSIEPGERPEEAAVRELQEESGLEGVVSKSLGVWESGYQNQIWGLYLMSTEHSVPTSFSFYTEDDGGHKFDFFWQPLDENLDEQWHSLFSGAIGFIKKALS